MTTYATLHIVYKTRHLGVHDEDTFPIKDVNNTELKYSGNDTLTVLYLGKVIGVYTDVWKAWLE